VHREHVKLSSLCVFEHLLDCFPLADVSGKGRFAFADVLGTGRPPVSVAVVGEDAALRGDGEMVLARLSRVADAEQEGTDYSLLWEASSSCLRHDVTSSSFSLRQRSDAAGSHTAISFAIESSGLDPRFKVDLELPALALTPRQASEFQRSRDHILISFQFPNDAFDEFAHWPWRRLPRTWHSLLLSENEKTGHPSPEGWPAALTIPPG
jgi:hypothetical protein